MNMMRTVWCNRGFALPAVLLVLFGLGLLLVAGFHSARLELTAARSIAGSVHAFQGAEAGLALLEAGAWPPPEEWTGDRILLQAYVDTLWSSTDGAILVRLAVVAESLDPVGRRIGRRALERLWLRPAEGPAFPVDGTWRESIRIDP